jgi:hypothetical protein
MEPNDTHMGEWVYCKSHVGPHSTGWCGVSAREKIPLRATNREEAMKEAWAMGFSIFDYCDVCHKFVANEPWHQIGGQKNCPEHECLA